MTDMPVTLPAGVSLRGSVYHLRIGIPKDIQHLWGRQANGKLATDAYRASLKTSDRNEAASRAHAIIAEQQRRFEALRAGSRPTAPTPVTDELVAYIVQKIERDVLALDDLLRSNPRYLRDVIRSTAPRGRLVGDLVVDEAWDTVGDYLDPDQYESASEIRAAIARLRRTDYMVGRLDAARAIADTTCASLAIRVDWQQPQARAALQKILGALVRAWENASKRDSGEPVETPADPVRPVIAKPEEVAEPVKTLRDVMPLWVAHRSANAESIKRTIRALDLFEQAVGKVPLKDLTRAIGAQFVRFLLDAEARGFGNTTAKHQGTCITSLLNVAVTEELIDKVPFTLKIDRNVGAKKREAWTDEQLKLMYSHSLFSGRIGDTPRWQDVDPADGRALLLILQHTGARIGEVAQLRREDFLTRSGIVSIRITAEAGTVKTQESERVVPLAAHLLDDPWFANWLENVMAGTGNAMPTLCGRARGPGDTAGQWFRQFRAAVGLPPGELEGAHKFRHWIRTSLAEADVSTETADSITGHSATGSSGRKDYTARAGLKIMKDALDRLTYPATFSDT